MNGRPVVRPSMAPGANTAVGSHVPWRADLQFIPPPPTTTAKSLPSASQRPAASPVLALAEAKAKTQAQPLIEEVSKVEEAADLQQDAVENAAMEDGQAPAEEKKEDMEEKKKRHGGEKRRHGGEKRRHGGEEGRHVGEGRPE